MLKTLSFQDLDIIADCEQALNTQGGYTLTGSSVRIQLPDTPRYFYHHGWQSWSLAAWTTPQPLPEPRPVILQPMQFDPVYIHHPSPHGNWLGAVDFANDNVLLLGALSLDTHVQLREGQLQGWHEGAGKSEFLPCRWFVGYGPEQEVFKAYAYQLGQTFGAGQGAQPYRVWCSWYSLYTAIDEQILSKTFHVLKDMPFDVIQVDDGWQTSVGDWWANDKFPAGMPALVNEIKATGRKAGLWMAPFIAVESSQLFQQHPDWFIHNDAGQPISAGFNWGERLRALDTTHPQVLTWLADLMKQVRTWGFEYLKLDFLYGAALPGKRFGPQSREMAYRQGLSVVREALGDAYLLTCGAPILPSLGLCDGLRVGPDVAARWESWRDAHVLCNPGTPGVKNAIRTTINRLWLSPLLHTDPDVAFFRSQETRLDEEQSRLMQELAYVCNFKATSDLPQWLTNEECLAVRKFLLHQPKIIRTGRYTFLIGDHEVDFSPAMDIPLSRDRSPATPIILWGGDQPWIIHLFDRFSKRNLEKIKQRL